MAVISICPQPLYGDFCLNSVVVANIIRADKTDFIPQDGNVKVNIRIMTIDDYERVYTLWLNTPNMGLNNLDDSKDGIAKYLARNPYTSFVAEKDGVIIGVIMCGHDGRRGYIHHTAVAESEQRNGVGAALLNAAISALERESINKAALVVFDKNEKGNAFWEKQGFTMRPDLIYRNKAIVDLTRIDT